MRHGRLPWPGLPTGVAILMGILAVVIWRNRNRLVGRGPFVGQQVVLYFFCLVAIAAALGAASAVLRLLRGYTSRTGEGGSTDGGRSDESL